MVVFSKSAVINVKYYITMLIVKIIITGRVFTLLISVLCITWISGAAEQSGNNQRPQDLYSLGRSKI